MSYFVRFVGVAIVILGLLGFLVLVMEAIPETTYGEPNGLLIGYGIGIAATGIAIGTMWYYIGKVGAQVEAIAARTEVGEASCPHCAEPVQTSAEACPHCGLGISIDQAITDSPKRRVCERSYGVHVAAQHDECPHCGEPVTDGRHPPLEEASSA
jgi:RNA polymerase subunit RPABC4/transcription elongation factor Spt4